MTDAIARSKVTIGGAPAAAAQAARVSAREQVVDGVRVTLEGQAVAGERSRFTYRFVDAATGEPVTGLRPYLAAAGHVVIMPTAGRGFAREHAEVEDRSGKPVFALPGQTFGPDLGLHADFPRPGLYRLWGQFRLADGRVITTQFTVDAHDDGPVAAAAGE
jgi:P-type Cu+ transporter